MESRYDATKFEQKIYRQWESSGAFQPKLPDGSQPTTHNQTFTIVMPPPNANDPLHIGHAMFVTVEDIMIRYQRMRGKAALWLPGTDHAGIETQFVFEKKLAKEGKSRFGIDRNTLYKLIWDYVQENSGVAVNQMKRLGASCDWSRFKFTLNPDIVSFVLKTFKKLHHEGLVYRDYRLVNYCTHCGTGFSDLEVLHEVRRDPLLYMKYGDFTIATVRPETKFRDTALAVNPDDPRFKEKIGKSYEIMGLLGLITMKVIADPEVDPKFGTGIMKVTPAHDFHDYELGKKYDLPITPIIDFKGKMDFSWFLNRDDFDSLPKKFQERAKQYHGLHVSKARPLMIEHLKEDGLLVKVNESYEHAVALCYRCKSLLEPLPLAQFFIKVKPLAKRALKALDNHEVKIHGAGHDKILKNWLANLKDWNISRQIVWGIRLPVWYSLKENPSLQVTYLKTDGEQVLRSGEGVLKTKELDEAKAGLQQLKAPIGSHYVIKEMSPGPDYLQETDTFDTWFSSSQWPVVTLKTGRAGDFKRFYPTDMMETAYDILPFWVMRMLMMGLHLTEKVPFKGVYFHGLIRDEQGQKMSKSKGNVINPLTMIEKYGADALRMALVIRSTPGLDKGVGEGDIRAMRNLTNKVWNSVRFVTMQSEHPSHSGGSEATDRISRDPIASLQDDQKQNDEEFFKKLDLVVSTVTQQLDDYRIGLAAETVYNEFWHWFCDECIEQSKRGEISKETLMTGLVTFLKLLHPFVPFVTEAAWQELQRLRTTDYGLRPSTVVGRPSTDLLISSPWPTPSSKQS